MTTTISGDEKGGPFFLFLLIVSDVSINSMFPMSSQISPIHKRKKSNTPVGHLRRVTIYDLNLALFMNKAARAVLT